MCGRFNLRATPAELREYFDLVRKPDPFPFRYNIAPTASSRFARTDFHPSYHPCDSVGKRRKSHYFPGIYRPLPGLYGWGKPPPPGFIGGAFPSHPTIMPSEQNKTIKRIVGFIWMRFIHANGFRPPDVKRIDNLLTRRSLSDHHAASRRRSAGIARWQCQGCIRFLASSPQQTRCL